METIYVLGFGFVVLAYCGVAMMKQYNDFISLLGMYVTAGSALVAVFACIFAFSWIAAEHKAALINKQLGTSYTQEDIFYASEYIEEVREMHRQRVELNGDLMRDE